MIADFKLLAAAAFAKLQSGLRITIQKRVTIQLSRGIFGISDVRVLLYDPDQTAEAKRFAKRYKRWVTLVKSCDAARNKLRWLTKERLVFLAGFTASMCEGGKDNFLSPDKSERLQSEQIREAERMTTSLILPVYRDGRFDTLGFLKMLIILLKRGLSLSTILDFVSEQNGRPISLANSDSCCESKSEFWSTLIKVANQATTTEEQKAIIVDFILRVQPSVSKIEKKFNVSDFASMSYEQIQEELRGKKLKDLRITKA